MSDPLRPDPDALLAVANRERRGRLKVFFGAAPGVGKTYAMLAAAREAAAAQRRVLVGIVETHGRRETEAMLEGLTRLPPRSLVHRNRMMPEFDLDGALAARPDILLVDELAHTNVPGSRHPKRWQDVKELVAAGIEVWTTLNVQHLESLNDVVLQITGVRVRETVPDTVFEGADEVVVVDLPPDELLKRLADGKVYIQDTAKRAVEAFFKPQNLTALRELALRRTAETVDHDLTERMRAAGVEGPWAAGERILALVGPDPLSQAVVRASKRMADLMDAPWIALYVERPNDLPDEPERRRIEETLNLARDLGGVIERAVGAELPQTVLGFARAENVTHIVIGRARTGPLRELIGRSLPLELVRRADGIGVHVVTQARETARAALPWRLPDLSGLAATPLIGTLGLVTVAALLADQLRQVAPLPNLSMVFLTAVLASAVLYGTWPAVATSLLSFVAYNFLFVEPRFTFSIADGHDILALVIFLCVGLATSALAGRVRDQARIATKRTRAARRLTEIAGRLSAAAGAGDVAEVGASEAHQSLGRSVVVLLEAEGDIAVAAAWPPIDALDAGAMAAARWAFEKREPAGAATRTLPNVPWLFLPLSTARRTLGAIGVSTAVDEAAIDPEMRTLLAAIAEQTAAALERAGLSSEVSNARTAAETERVRNTLLASISHDFRTPLAAIMGAATGLRDLGDRMSPQARADLLDQVTGEAEHLDRMVRDLLAITRLEAGALELRRDWVDVGETLERVAIAERRRHPGRTIRVEAGVSALVSADQTLIEQALVNVIENALRHGGPEAVVVLSAGKGDGAVAITIDDDGAGVPPGAMARIFEKFVSAPASDRRPTATGAGLGLAIAKGIAEAHGGSIAAESPGPSGRGTRVRLILPLPPRDGA